MNKLLNTMLMSWLVVILSGNLSAKTLNSNSVQSILYRENVDLDVKSIKGWMRVFNSQSKLEHYEICVSEKEKEKILLFLKGKYHEEYNRYAKVVK